ncbi:MAG: hypothetical protein NVSMB57_07570 [Actinomycetota bacterium]
MVGGAVLGAANAHMPKAVVAAGLLGGLGWRFADLPAMRARRAHGEAVRRSLPDAIDLLVVCVHAGMGLDPAFRLVAGSIDGPLSEAFDAAIRASEVGLDRDACYDAFIAAASVVEAEGFVTALRRADRYGASISETLTAFATETRERSLAAMREHALGASVRMLFPLTLCFLPAFVLLAVAPSLVVALRAFRHW